jgi:hypothetical protein
MANLNGLKSAEFVRSAIAQLEAEGLNRATLEASMDWLEANAEAVQVPRSGLMRRAQCAAEQLVFKNAKPRESFSDRPEWYAEEWLGWIPGMHDANFFVRAGASELALHAIAVSRLARVAERAQESAAAKRAKRKTLTRVLCVWPRIDWPLSVERWDDRQKNSPSSISSSPVLASLSAGRFSRSKPAFARHATKHSS